MLEKIQKIFKNDSPITIDPDSIIHSPGLTVTDFNTVPSLRDIYRGRYNYGVNLGSCFVLESWIYNDLFGKGGLSEFDAVTLQVNSSSVNQAAALLISHYSSYVDSLDWNWLKNVANITALRVPIGYWHVGNAQFVDGLPYAPLKAVYQQANPWGYLKTLISRAASNNIGILIDVHGLPGGANTSDSSGFNNVTATFFSNQNYINRMADEVLPFIARDVCVNNINVIGLQIVNEADFDNTPTGQQDYYFKAIKSIGNVDSNLPVIISDGWWYQQFADWLQSTNLASNAIIDSHIYRCYSASDKAKTVQQLTNDLYSTVNYPSNTADFVTGEFSCVLDENSWQKTSGNRNQLIQTFGQTETSIFSKVSSWGWFFWTLKFQYGDGGEWGFVPQINSSNIPKRPITSSNIVDWGQVEQRVQQHIAYWADKGGDKMEHWRFIDAIYKAGGDITEFSKFSNSRVGRWYQWTQYRRQQYIALKGDSQYMWEWDQGYQAGLNTFNHY